MNNRVVFAAAGNGKTYSVCAQAKEAVKHGSKCVLLISYTNEGVRSLEREYKKQNSGVLDDRVVFKTWYTFMLSEFIKPYQCLLNLKDKRRSGEYSVVFPENFVTSIAFYGQEPLRVYNSTHVQYYVNTHGDVYPNRTSHLAYLCDECSGGKAVARMEQIYSHVFIDELQDYAGWDLEIIRRLFESNMVVLCTGDHKQATYRTNSSPKNKQYRDENVRKYFIELEKRQLCSVSYANTTRRFNKEICDFVNTIHNDKDAMIVPESTNEQGNLVENTGVYLVDLQYLKAYCGFYHPVLLRYDKRSKIPFLHDCRLFNYGGSKGATYERTVIIPVSTAMPFIKTGQSINSNQTRSKFYVACTRAKHSIVFAMSAPKENDRFKPAIICLGDMSIPAFRFVV